MVHKAALELSASQTAFINSVVVTWVHSHIIGSVLYGVETLLIERRSSVTQTTASR